MGGTAHRNPVRRRRKASPGKPRQAGNAEKIARLTRALLEWFAASARDLPWRRTRAPYAVWVSEIMLQQTQVSTVIPYWERWMRELPDLQALSRASSHKLHKLWEGLGYYSRVRNMQKTAQLILRQHRGRFPDAFDTVHALPGIGRYTAGAICSIAFNQPTPVLDGNVIRVLTRVFGVRADPRTPRTNARLWNLAAALVTRAARLNSQSAIRNPQSNSCSSLNQSLMELGATVCTPRNPYCPKCPIRRHCTAHQEGLTDRIPHRRKRCAVLKRTHVIVVAQHRGRFWAVRRSAGGLNGGLWEFPRLEEVKPAGSGSRKLRMQTQKLKRLGTLQQTITRYRITLEVYSTTSLTSRSAAGSNGRWLSPSEIDRFPFSAAHRKIALRAIQPGKGVSP